MKHSPLYIPTDGVAVVIDGTASGTLTACVEYVCSVRTPAVALCLDHGAPLVIVPAVPGHRRSRFRNSEPLHALQYLHTYTLSIAQAIARTEPACVPCVRRY